jgi:hypothetical protein
MFNVWRPASAAGKQMDWGKNAQLCAIGMRGAVRALLVHFSRFHTSACCAGNKPDHFKYDEAD